MSKNKENERKRSALLGGASMLAAAVALVGVAPTASAQDDAVAEEEEAIVVTGSRIARANLTSPTAVTTVDAQTIELSGEDNIAEVLRGVPSFGESGITSGNSNFATSSFGVNTLQLRNLGEDRTLVLVNGRRYVAGVPASSAVDFNSIPTDLIERVEVVTGGASAIYGADALAGVINLLLRDDFEGIEYRYQYGESDYGDDVNHRFSVLLGGNFADGRGNVVINAAYTNNGGVYARDRPDTQFDNLSLCALTDDPADCQTGINEFFGGPGLVFSSYGPYGRFYDYEDGGSYAVSTGTGYTAGISPWSTAAFGFNRQSQRRYTTPTERFMLSGIGSYEITPSIEAFTEATYAHVTASTDFEPYPFSNFNLGATYFGVPCDNPYVPADLFAVACDNGATILPFTRRMVETGNRGGEVNRNTFRLLLGLRGDFADRFNWETFYSYGRTEEAQNTGGQLNVSNFRQALDVIDQDGNPLTADDRICADPDALAAGCVPINIFGLGAITPEAAAWVAAPVLRQSTTTQEIIGANISGPLFSMPAGDAEFAFGLEWRREQSDVQTDALTRTGQNASNIQEPITGGYRVGELYAEVEVPLLRDAPLAHELSIGGAFRWSDYNTLGETEAYTGRIQWAPTEWLRFRAQYARAVRVPNIGELFGPGGEDFLAVSDVCDGTTAVNDPGTFVDDNCRADPLIAARIASEGIFELTLPERQGTGGFSDIGNPDLQPETADSLTIGAVFNQDFGRVGSLLVSLDWYQIEIENIISRLTRQGVIDECYNVDPADFPDAECANLVRQDVFANPASNGAILEVNTDIRNFDEVSEYSGVDLSVAWSFALADWFGSVPGDVSLRMNWTHLLVEGEDGDEPGDNDVGTTGSPENKILAGAIYNLGAWTFSWETSWIQSTQPSNTNPAFFYDIGDYTTHDLRVGWDVSESANLYFGANNLFDEEEPLILSGVTGNVTGTNTNAAIFDPIGRTWYAGIRLRY